MTLHVFPASARELHWQFVRLRWWRRSAVCPSRGYQKEWARMASTTDRHGPCPPTTARKSSCTCAMAAARFAGLVASRCTTSASWRTSTGQDGDRRKGGSGSWRREGVSLSRSVQGVMTTSTLADTTGHGYGSDELESRMR